MLPLPVSQWVFVYSQVFLVLYPGEPATDAAALLASPVPGPLLPSASLCEEAFFGFSHSVSAAVAELYTKITENLIARRVEAESSDGALIPL